MSDRIVYTAIFGGKDKVREPFITEDGINYVLFTDDPELKSKRWQTVLFDEKISYPRLFARRLKLLSHRMFPEAKSTLWIDGRVALRQLNGVFDCKHDFAVHRHPRRNCIYQEIKQCQRLGQDSHDVLNAIRRRYRAESIPFEGGLWMTGILFRRHTEAVKRFNEAWWAELSENSIRDQISLPYLLQKPNHADLNFGDLPAGIPQAKVGSHAIR